MKPLTVSECDNLADCLRALIGARLQSVECAEADVRMEFFLRGNRLWLWIDLHPSLPMILPFSAPMRFSKKMKKPMGLFLNAHFCGRRLESIERPEDSGRVIVMNFTGGARLEARLFPAGRNLMATIEDKHLHWLRPKPLPSGESHSGSDSIRDLETLRTQWRALRGLRSSGEASKSIEKSQESGIAKKLGKLKRALGQVEKSLAERLDQPWREIGEWLKSNQSLKVPEPWPPFIDAARSLAWNIQNCFTKAEEVERKIGGTRERRAQLVNEIRALESGEVQVAMVADPRANVKAGEDRYRGRTLNLDNGMRAVVGKSAGDNLKLLRMARAWDYWFHVKDQPSAHLILFRDKGQEIKSTTIRVICQWYLRQVFGKKYEKMVGEKLPIQYAEVRHIRPIKGDRLGRVGVQNEKVFIAKIEP